MMYSNGFSTFLQTVALLLAICTASVASYAANPGTNQYQYSSLDQITVWLPYDQAATAAVALAKINLLLYEAKKRAEQSVCGGQWHQSGVLLVENGPYLTTDTDIDQASWFYRSLRQPYTDACRKTSRMEFFREMSKHLPPWLTVRPAGQLTTFRQGMRVTIYDHASTNTLSSLERYPSPYP